MATIQATLDQPPAEASAAIRRAAEAQGWAYSGLDSGPAMLVFTKGLSAFSWGSTLRVRVEPVSATQTRFTFATVETFSITDWGRGRRAIERLLAAVGEGVQWQTV
jgi:hypothetical protein